jgi:Ras-related protein Rab-1A
MSFDSYDYLIKCLVIGDSGIGKSSLMLRFTDDVFNSQYISTIGVDFKIKTMSVKNKIFKFQIWDTAGQDRFRTITSSYYRGSNAILICYDVTERETFHNVSKWLEEAKIFSTTNPFLILCGTKSDLSDKRKVSICEGKEYAKNNNMLFFETSAKNNLNITEIFESIAENKIIAIKFLSCDEIQKNNYVHNKKKINLELEHYQNMNDKKKCC